MVENQVIDLLTKALLSALSAAGVVLCILAFRLFVRDVFRLVRETCREDGEEAEEGN